MNLPIIPLLIIIQGLFNLIKDLEDWKNCLILLRFSWLDHANVGDLHS